MNAVISFRDTQAIALRAAEVTGADWDGGMNNSCNCPGVGVATDNPGLAESLPSWTLLDQFEAARVPQVSQVLGGLGYTNPAGYPSSGGLEGNGAGHGEFLVGLQNDGDGAVTVLGTANLADLAVGWALA